MSEPVFSAEERERYARHFVLPEIGGPGQQKLKKAHVLIIGAGGLGAPALQYLAAAGVGEVTIVDDDTVDLSNLQRQVIHSTQSVGLQKSISAETAVHAINPHVRINAITDRLTQKNAADLVSHKTIVLDGSDNFETRYLLAETCEHAKVPLITAAVNRFDGSITTLKPWASNETGIPNPRYRDLFPEKPADSLLPTCSEAGVMGATTGIMGTLQAMECIKEIVGLNDSLVGKLMMFDGLAMRFQTINYKLLSDLGINMFKRLCKLHENPSGSFSETVHTDLFYKIHFSEIFFTFFNKIEK